MERRTSLRTIFVALVVGLGLGGGCGEDPVNVQVRALERSGQTSFVCLGAPGTAPLPLDACVSAEAESPDDYAVPHLYALVTQTTRGEIAVIDLTSASEPVLDQDDRVPGANFLPVGAQPIDVVSTPGGVASFVSVAEIGREGIFAIPSAEIRPDGSPPTLTSWPACALPSAPGELILVTDPQVDGQERATCDGDYGAPAAGNALADLSQEEAGRYKIVATLPEEGGIVVIDAQALLDREPGTYAPCEIERWVPLQVDLPPPPDPPPTPDPPAGCVETAPAAATSQGDYTARPAGMALSDDRLFIADLDAPVVHVLDVETPCEPLERPSLLPSSLSDPSRVVTTNRVAVSPRGGPDFKRYLYAVDVAEGSAMVFDVSDDTTSRSPLVRPDAYQNPFQPADRLRYSAAIRDIVIVSRDEPAEHPATGVASVGTRCDPDPGLEVCDVTSQTCDPETLYYTAEDLSKGAGPELLRGSFAFLLLSSGVIVVIDIDDYDAACRAPEQDANLHYLAGCPGPFGPTETSAGATGEVSCKIVAPHEARSGRFLLSREEDRNLPGLQSFPLLYDATGGLVPDNSVDPPWAAPQMIATSPNPKEGAIAPKTFLQVGGNDPFPLKDPDQDASFNYFEDENGALHTLVMNIEDPRAHVADQEWLVTAEGPLPGFSEQRADLRLNGEEDQGLYDSSSRFCDGGVLSILAQREIVSGYDLTEEEMDALAILTGDRVQIAQPLVDEDDFYWNGASCSFQECRAVFGTVEAPTLARDIPIVEAYQDHLVLAAATSIDPETGEPVVRNELAECCFPTLVAFRVRPGFQWTVTGSGSGFLHHVVADPETGVCRNSCDPARARLNGRVPYFFAEEGAEVVDGSRAAFQNPMFRFAVVMPSAESLLTSRDYQFRFKTQGAFNTLVVSLVGDTLNIQPQSMSFLPSTGEIIVADGSLEGLLVVGTDSLVLERQYQ